MVAQCVSYLSGVNTEADVGRKSMSVSVMAWVNVGGEGVVATLERLRDSNGEIRKIRVLVLR